MNAYNPLASMKRLEQSGLPRPQAEAIASEITEGANSLVTKEQLDAAMDRLTVRLGAMVAGIVALACTVMGVLISIK